MSSMYLTFAALSMANRLRLPQFKNKHGEPAHSKPDGSDWNPSQWICATMGELGELAEVRLDFEHGLLTHTELQTEGSKEAADVQAYHTISCMRLLDKTQISTSLGRHELLMQMIVALGLLCNTSKKADRGDITPEVLDAAFEEFERKMQDVLCSLRNNLHEKPAEVIEAHHSGVNLPQASVLKFNEVSKRVGSDIELTLDGQVTQGGQLL